MEPQKTGNIESNLKKEQNKRYRVPGFKTILQSYSNQNSIFEHKKRHIDQWNIIENPKINPCIYGQGIYENRTKNIQWEKDNLLNK